MERKSPARGVCNRGKEGELPARAKTAHLQHADIRLDPDGVVNLVGAAAAKNL